MGICRLGNFSPSCLETGVCIIVCYIDTEQGGRGAEVNARAGGRVHLCLIESSKVGHPVVPKVAMNQKENQGKIRQSSRHDYGSQHQPHWCRIHA